LANLLEATLHPAWYHGHRTKPPYLEGWYFKLISAGQKYRYAVIPGIFKGAGSEASHAFVQVRLSVLAGRQERPIFEGTGHSAGLEVAGDIARLLS
jgi:hypothetical protein